MAEATSTAFRFRQHLHGFPLSLFMTRYHHLCDAFAVGNEEWFIREVDQDDTDFATIVGIDGARSIQHGDAMLDGQAAARTHLCLETRRQSHEEPCRNKASFHWPQLDGRLYIRTKIDACRLRRGILWQRMMAAIDYLYFHWIIYYYTSGRLMPFILR